MVKSARYTVMQRQVPSNRLSRVKGYIAAHTRRCALIAAGVLLVIFASLYTWYSIVSWQALSVRTDEVRESTKTAVTRLEQQSHEVEEIGRVAKRLKVDIDEMCEVSPLIQWHAHVVASTGALLGECHAEQRKLREVRRALAVIYVRAESEQKFAQHMSATLSALNAIDPVEYDARRTQWKEARVPLDELELHSSLDEAHAAAMTATDEIIASYDLLVEANKREDRAAFDEASDALRKGYSKLGAVQNHSVESYDQLIDTLQVAMNQL